MISFDYDTLPIIRHSPQFCQNTPTTFLHTISKPLSGVLIGVVVVRWWETAACSWYP